MALPNLVVRILTGIVFVAIILGSILFNQYSYLVVFLIIELLALHEFYGLINKSGRANTSKTLNMIGGGLLFLGTFAFFAFPKFQSIIIFVPYIVYLLVLFITSLYQKDTDTIRSLAYSFLGQMYIAVPFSLLNYIAFSYLGGTYHYIYMLALFILIWVNDSFAYLTGSQFGKHRLFERISPKKSWEGSIGGALFTILAVLILAHFYTELSLLGWIGFAIVVIVFGTWGDLIESLLKRTIGIKDSGNILPGHGGILDRFDSMIFTIPALFVYLELLSFFNI